MTTIGQNSPATPVPSTALPSGVGRSPASERVGTSVPSEVVASATPRTHHSASRPLACRTTPAPSPIASETAHPVVPSRSARRGTCLSITSRPAMKNRKASPSPERKEMKSLSSAMPSTAGPIRMPSAISTTTVGSTSRVCSLERSAPSAQARSTSTSDRPSACVISAARSSGGITPPARPARLRGPRDSGAPRPRASRRPPRARRSARRRPTPSRSAASRAAPR